MTRLVPAAVRRQIIDRLVVEAGDEDWDHLQQADKSALIARWVDAPEIGRRLAPLLGSDAEVRLWIKDVGLKNRARGLLPQAADVARAVLGDEALVRERSVAIKPLRCVADCDGRATFIAWDRVANAKHLVWAGLVKRDEGFAGDIVIAFVEKVTELTPQPERERVERIAARCGVTVRWIDP